MCLTVLLDCSLSLYPLYEVCFYYWFCDSELSAFFSALFSPPLHSISRTKLNVLCIILTYFYHGSATYETVSYGARCSTGNNKDDNSCPRQFPVSVSCARVVKLYSMLVCCSRIQALEHQEVPHSC
uniref:Uncharacterized protein n=1 Tax=Chelydra serpentina TaxID=8475 RepID=A0A8C3XKJ8_CHESE